MAPAGLLLQQTAQTALRPNFGDALQMQRGVGLVMTSYQQGRGSGVAAVCGVMTGMDGRPQIGEDSQQQPEQSQASGALSHRGDHLVLSMHEGYQQAQHGRRFTFLPE